MTAWRRIFALIVKELLAILRDKKSRIVLIGPPIAQLLVFGYAATFDLNNLAIAVYDQDRSAASRELIAKMTGSPHFELVAQVEHDAQIAPLIDNKDALMVLRIGPRFSETLLRGDTGAVQVIIDGRNSNTALLALSYVRSILIDFNVTWAKQHGRPSPPATLEIRPWYNENLESRWFIVPGIVGLMALIITTVVTSLSVAREREAGTFDQLLVTPLRPIEILIGKSIPGMLIGLVEATFILVLVVLWFEVPLRGSLGALYLGVLLFLLSAVGIGLMISSFAVTQQQGILGAFLFAVPAVILSGFATPIDNMPDIVQQLTLINPMRYFMVILRGVFLRGDSYGLLFEQFWPMAVIGVVSLAIAGWLFRHRMY
ncbi:ABC transporter permease [Thiosocius teredinicola]|uniref:ABC transporter permease n=1 Tax=Thiosocius teredinicola TaxID=1973002 RepID=UPI000990C5D3